MAGERKHGVAQRAGHLTVTAAAEGCEAVAVESAGPRRVCRDGDCSLLVGELLPNLRLPEARISRPSELG